MIDLSPSVRYRPSRRLPVVGGSTLVLMLGVLGAPGPVSTAAGTARGADQTVVLLGTTAVRAAPRQTAPRVATVAARRPLTGTRTVLPVVQRRTDTAGRRWLRVRLPGRTLGNRPPPQTGWILRRRTRPATAPWRIVVDRDRRRVTVLHHGVPSRSFRAIVGAPATPTPRGRFLVEESVRLPSHRAGAPFALATSARSGVLQEFAGGPGQIALHGRRGLGGRLGTAVSHGCVRLSDPAIRWIADRVGPGARVTIR